MEDLKAYVGGTGLSRVEATRSIEGVVLLDITHNYLKNNYVEIPFELDWNLSRIKDKVYTTCGTSPEHMTLQYNGTTLTDPNCTLRQMGCTNRGILHVIDTDPFSNAKNGGLEDVSQIKKYEMSTEDYRSKTEGTYYAYKQKMLAADPNWVPKHVAEARAAKLEREGPPPEAETLEQAMARVKVGDRCEVVGGKRGVVRYVGDVPELAKGKWEGYTFIGVEYDEAEGKHDGAIGDKRYFTASPMCGAFVLSNRLQAGDFPEVDPFASSDDEDVDEEL
jgi:tubulin-folding cofactor B